MFYENSLMLYQQDLQLDPYFATGNRSKVAQISNLLFCKIIIVAQIPRVV